MRIRSIEQGITVLTPAEQCVLERMISGKTNKEIAAEMHLSVSGVQYHKSGIFRKLRVDGVNGSGKTLAMLRKFGRFEVTVTWVANRETL